MNFNVETIADAIRTRRMHLNYKQEYVAGRLNVSQNAYSKLELNITVLTVRRLVEVCHVLNLDPCELIRQALSLSSEK